MLLDCVIYCAFYSILFRGGRFFPVTVYIPRSLTTATAGDCLCLCRSVAAVVDEAVEWWLSMGSSSLMNLAAASLTSFYMALPMRF